jgi:predicted unusual protein kinase regulating ubiquinone biosynthesis (AarF/ABC1/UbiB family)
MVGRVRPNMRAGMREMVIGVGTRDAARLVNSYKLLGILLPEADLSLLEQAEAELFDRFWGKDMTELTQVSLEEVTELAVQFRELLYALPFQIPEDLILLGRTVGILSGMCTGLDPKFNVWDNVAPFARKLIAEDEAGGSAAWIDALTGIARRLLDLPRRVETVLDKLERGQLVVQEPKLVEQVRRVEGAADRIGWSIVFAALFIGGVQLFLAGASPFAEGVLLVSAFTFLGLLIKRNSARS